MPEQFHFLHPEWLWALAPLAVLLAALLHPSSGSNPWLAVVDRHLLPHLLLGNGHGAGRRRPLVLLALGWLIAVLALANPAWERLPQPVLQSRQALVVVLDLSRSMLTPDLAPSRMERVRYKIADLLARRSDGQTALVAYAGDAFTVAPLSDDNATMRSLLGALEPGIMPASGSRPDRGLTKANKLLTQVGAQHGEVLLVADDAGSGTVAAATLDAARALAAQGHTVSVLAAATAEGAPLPGVGGGVQRDGRGKVVVPRLDETALRELATIGGGRFALVSADDRDLESLFPPRTLDLDTEVAATDLETETWRGVGPWLVLALLPLGLIAFRRGWLAMLAGVAVLNLGSPGPAMAASWQDLWQRPDQQADQALATGDNKRAIALAEDPMRRGVAYFREGDHAAAAESFAGNDSVDAHYNRGNALALMDRLEDALAAYDKALAKAPKMEDAIYNRAQVEAALKQRRAQQPSQESSSGKDGESAGQPSGSAGSDPQDGENRSGQTGSQERSGQSASQGDQDGQDRDEQAVGRDGKGGDPQNGQERSGQSASQDDQSDDPRDAQNSDGQTGAEVKDENRPAQQGGQPGATPNAQTGQPAAEEDDASLGRQDKAQAQGSTGEDASGQQQALAPGDRVDDERGQNRSDGDRTEGEDGRSGSPGETESLSPTPSEESLAMEQWLRRIPDDPGGLLRRKFLYQYRQRGPIPSGQPGGETW